jgi:CRP/FNR family cyclic AMP-dependent transcriptional regulator
MQRTTIDLLKKSPVFRELGAGHLAEVASLAQVTAHNPGQVIVRQGDHAESMFMIDSGFLKVLIEGRGGSLSTLGVMGEGEIFGELSLLDGGTRSATVTTMTRARLVSLDRDPFLRLVEARPQVAIGIMKVLARRLRVSSVRSDDLKGMRVANRLAKQILLLADRYKQETGPARLRVGIRLSQRELGELVGATRESVNKHLRAWRETGILTHDGGYITITDVALLRSIAVN